MHGQKMRRYKQYSQIEDESWQRDIRVFSYSLAIGLLLGGFGVYLFMARPTVQHVNQLGQLVAQCEKDKTTLADMRDEGAKKLAACNTRLSAAPKAAENTPPETIAGDPLPVPQDTTAGVPPIPRRPPSRPAGEQPAIEIVGAAKVGAPQTATFKIGDEKELVAGFKIRLVGIAKRKSGTYCVIGGSGQPAVGTRIQSGGSTNVSWNNQKLNLAATRQDAQSCKVTVKPL